ncbi:MAG: CRISPR-associated helicase Cas3' [candidate division WOR-3 bacterium]
MLSSAMEEPFVSGPDELLAKPDVGLLDHSRQTAEAGYIIARSLNLEDKALQKALFACAFHDIGKATKSFQEYIRGKKERSFPHALASFPLVYLLEKKIFKDPPEASLAVLSHHTPIHSTLYNDYRVVKPPFHEAFLKFLGALIDQMNLELDEDFLSRVIEELQKIPPYDFWARAGEEHRNIKRSDFAQIKTVLQLADWAASGRKDPQEYFLAEGRNRVEEHIKERKKIRLHGFQEKCWEAGNPLFLRAPTGSGKTEALVGWAANAGRIIYLLPTQATSNAMFERLKNIFCNQTGLSHGKASFYLRSQVELEEEAWDERLLASSFAKPVNVATLDQLLLAHLNGRYWEIKETLAQHGALVFDEIHAYEPYTLGILLSALENLKNGKLAFASATFPSPLLETIRESLGQEGQVVEAEGEFWNKRRHKIRISERALEEVLPEIVDMVNRGKNVLVVLNSVEDAQNFFKQARERLGEKAILLHSRFINRHRTKLEELAKSPPGGFLLVSTQVVEVSLDISYDVLFTQIAPLDALVQRMGRANRYGELGCVPVEIMPESDNSKLVYEEKALGILALTREILTSMASEPSDGEIRRGVEELYEYLFKTEKFRTEMKEGQMKAKQLREELGLYSLLLEEKTEQRLTRKGMLTVEVIPRKFEAEACTLVEQKQSWKLSEIMVSVPWWWVKDRGTPGPTPWSTIADIDYEDNLGAIKPSEPSDESAIF